MRKGCLLSLIASLMAFLLLALELIFDYMGWPGFNGAGMHVGAWVFAWPVLFGVSYGALLAMDSRRVTRKRNRGK
jgi:hypothetical protein